MCEAFDNPQNKAMLVNYVLENMTDKYLVAASGMDSVNMIKTRKIGKRFILGSGKNSLKLIEAAVKYAGAELITLAVRRANTKEEENILDYIPKE